MSDRQSPPATSRRQPTLAEAVKLARQVLKQYAQVDAEHPENAHIKTDEEVLARALIAVSETASLDAARYQRLRILGCAPMGTKHLSNGTVMRFTNLDEFLDNDIAAHPSRGEYERSAPVTETVPRSELEACNAEWNERYQRMMATEEALRAEINGLRAFKASVDEALNTGNGSYRP